MWSLTILVIVFSTFLTPLINAMDSDDWDSSMEESQEVNAENNFPAQENIFPAQENNFTTQENIFQSREVIALNLSSNNTQFSINIETNSTSYFVYVSDHLKTKWKNETVKLNLIIEELSCSSLCLDDSKLYIKKTNWSIKLCQDVDNAKNKFQSVSEAYDDEKHFEIIPEGNWGNDTLTARVAVSVYIERNSCKDCPQNFFCCGAKSNSCTSTFLKNKTSHTHEKVRCIPQESGTQRLLCNDHPNCGFYCNPDENKNFCENESYYEDNNGQTADVVWLVILFFIATLLIIASVIICVCFLMYIHQNGGCYNLIFKRKPEGSKEKGNVSTAQKNPAYTKEPEESFRYSSEYI